MLEECRRVARAGARMLFYVIAPAAGLTASALAEACEAGPPFVGLEGDYPGMLAASGWGVVERSSVTADYLAALRALCDAMQSDPGKLGKVFGRAEFEMQLQHRARQISAIERGLLIRELYLAETA